MDYDVVIIGAGIHGAGVAQSAAAAGYSVLVLEQFDGLAQGTSSKSSKLVHGGLRYLESAQFHLVYECLRERSILLNNAPHLVELAPFHIPVYASTRRRPWKIALGLFIYSVFSRRRFYRVPKINWGKLDGLVTENLDAVFNYYDAQTDDARLTRSVFASSQSLGADVITAATFECASVSEGTVELSYKKDGTMKTVNAGVLVNASGAWVNNVLAKIRTHPDNSIEPMDIELVQGAHIVVSGQISHPYYLEAPQDGRAVFVTPWQGKVMIGTTETDYQGDPADVAPLSSEISYLLEIYNHYFSQNLTPDNVVHAFAGLRVLPNGTGDVFTKSRDTHLLADNTARPRVISIYGGKLTSYRATAEKLIRLARRTLHHCEPVADTRKLKLPIVD